MKTRTVLAVVVAVCLVSLYVRSVSIVAAQGFLANAGAFQVGMILLQTLKLAVVLSFKRLREANMVVIFDIFSLELLILPLLVPVALLTASSGITDFEYGLFSTWPLSLALVFVPFAVYRATRGMLRDALPSSVIPLAVLVTGLAAFSAQVVTTPAGQAGTVDFTKALVGGFTASAGSIPPVFLDPVMAVALPLLYVSLVVYAAIGRTPAGASSGPALLIALVSSLVVLLWTAAFVSMPGAVLYFVVPTFGLLGAVWWSGRHE